MKKKFYAILLTSLFLIGIMASTALAAFYKVTGGSWNFAGDEGFDNATLVRTEANKGKITRDPATKRGTAVAYVSLTSGNDGGEGGYTLTLSGLTAGLTGELLVERRGNSDTETASNRIGNTAGSSITAAQIKVTLTATATGTYKVKLVATNTVAEGETPQNGESDELEVTVVDPLAPTWDATDGATVPDQANIAGAGYWADANSTFYSGQTFAEGREIPNVTFTAVTTNDPTDSKWKMTYTLTPSASGLSVVATPGEGDGNTNKLIGKLRGTMPNVSTKTEYTLKVVATDVGGNSETRTVKFNVTPATEISSSTKPGNITWGQAFSFTPALSSKGGVKSWAVVDMKEDGTEFQTGDTEYLRAAAFADNNVITGLKFSTSTGVISGTWTPTEASGDTAIGKGWNGSDIVKKVVLQATNGANTTDATKNSVDRQEFTLTFKGVAPTINETASAITSKFTTANLTYGTPVEAASNLTVTAKGPGSISWTAEPATGKLEDYGLVLTSADATGTTPATLTIAGTPTTTVKNMKLKITAVNDKGKSTVIEPTFSIAATDVHFYPANGDAAGTTAYTNDEALTALGLKAETGSEKKVGDTLSDTGIVFYAKPGPVKWTTTNLPTGLTFTVDTKDTTKATLKGSFTAARKSEDPDDTKFEIKAVNTNDTTKTASITGNLMVWAKPEITTAALFKKNVIETGTAYDFEITASNTPKKANWVVTAGTTSDGTAKTLVSTTGGTTTIDANGYKPTASVTGFGTSVIKVDSTAFNGDTCKLKLVGGLDCVPVNGEKIKFSITAGNPAGDTTKEFEVTVKGKAPTLKKEDITLAKIGDSATKDIKVTAGDGPITMKAYVDAKTAKKLFGVEDAIDLTTANVTGLLFTDDTNHKGAASIAYTGSGISSIYTSGMAYSKLPVTVEASNSDISTKAASAKYTVTIATSSTGKPSWQSVNDLSTEYKNVDLTANATLKSSNELLIAAGTALPAADNNKGLLFKAAGDGPWEITVKPETKNGLTATYNETAGTVGITGTVEAGKKDVTTKFTLTLKNPSTGETAKSDITIVAKQKPAVSDNNLTASVIYGKKVKLAPKATASSNGMKWLIRSVKIGVADETTYSDTDNTNAKTALKEGCGLDFDENKGAISGTPSVATGKDNPIVVTMVASTDLAIYDANDEVVTAKIAVLGEKAKLTTKKISVAIDGTDLSDKVIETNLKDVDSSRASVQFSGNFSEVEAVSGMSLVSGSDNTATFGSEVPSAVTKKASVTVTMTNYDTVTTGKLTITVDGAKPEISAVNAIDVTAGSSNTGSAELVSTGSVSQKIKWKVSTKPNVSGVSAKIKGDVNGATITVKANKRVADGTTATFSITATDSTTKKTSDPVEVTVNISNPTDTEAAPLEANDVAATPEAKTEAEKSDEKILGEGEVHMGAERTADKLTTQQRKFFEDEGYVIAAVLPEIEVTAAGQYDFEVDLDKEVETGAELVWFAFASKPTTDDEIVDFADEKGKETKVVPESHVVTVAPWLNAETKYAPVIAVKAAAKDADATTVEGVKEAAEAKTEE